MGSVDHRDPPQPWTLQSMCPPTMKLKLGHLISYITIFFKDSCVKQYSSTRPNCNKVYTYFV